MYIRHVYTACIYVLSTSIYTPLYTSYIHHTCHEYIRHVYIQYITKYIIQYIPIGYKACIYYWYIRHDILNIYTNDISLVYMACIYGMYIMAWCTFYIHTYKVYPIHLNQKFIKCIWYTYRDLVYFLHLLTPPYIFCIYWRIYRGMYLTHITNTYYHTSNRCTFTIPPIFL